MGLVLPRIRFVIPVYFRERVQIIVGGLLRIQNFRKKMIDRRHLEPLNIPASKRPKFTAGKGLKDAVN